MTIEFYVVTLIFLYLGHFLADYPLQGEFLAKAKNVYNPIPGIPWYQALFAHSFIHAGFVLLITSSLLFFLIEFVIHFLTDHAKCKGLIGYNTDQAIHLLTKVGFVAAMYVTSTPTIS